MVLEGLLEGDAADAAGRQRIADFLVSRGYRSEAGVWARGSLWGSLVGMSPRAWQAKVRLETERGDRCRVRFDINSTFQVVTEEEQRFYQSELDGALAVARGDSPPDLGPRAAAVRAANFRTVGHGTRLGNGAAQP